MRYIGEGVHFGELIFSSESESGGPGVSDGGGEVVVSVASGCMNGYSGCLGEAKRGDFEKVYSILEGEVLLGLRQISSQFEMVTDIIFYLLFFFYTHQIRNTSINLFPPQTHPAPTLPFTSHHLSSYCLQP